MDGTVEGAADTMGAGTDIAVIGMAGRFAGASDVDVFWKRVVRGDDCLIDLDRERLIATGIPASTVDDPAYVRRAGVLHDVEGFDHEFFGIGARDGAVMDPQHRHFLECAWESLESAAIVPERFDGAIGVFGGCGMNTYLINNLLTNGAVLEQLGWFLLRHTGNDKDFLTNNVSYRLDLRGPAINVQTACSTSLVAVHLAVQSLLGFESDVALAGGVTIDVPHGAGYVYHDGEILAADGVCRAFDARSNGTVLTSGVAVVTLRRLTDALDDGDPILAVIKGTAVNNDGSRKVGFLAPSVDAHAEVIREALSVAGLSAHDLQLFEGHGTGTAVGDPIEMAAATAAFRTWTDDRGFCRMSSTKPNIGHTDTAAGAASLIKVVQALRHRTLPPLANHTGANPLLDIDRTPFVLSGQADPWPGDQPRRAGISSLGVGGTNAHVIVEEAPPLTAPDRGEPEQIIVLSARSPKALDEAAHRLAEHLTEHPESDLSSVAHTLVAGRRAMPHRRVVTATDVPTAVLALRGDEPHRSSYGSVGGTPARLGLMFPGGGSQYPGMAAGLDARFDTFHTVRSRGVELVRQAGGVDLAPLLRADADPEALKPPTRSLPAVFVTCVALARQWQTFGAEPDLLLGHSLGEYTAAHLAGVMSFEDAVNLVVLRSELMQRASGDDAAMLVVPLSEAQVVDLLPPTLSLAVVNADDECVVAGRLGAIEHLAAQLEERGTPGSVIPLSAAAHSALLDPILDEFAVAVRGVRLGAPTVTYLSNLTGTWITPEQATDPQYWVDHLRGTVRFGACLRSALGDTPLVLTELGPGQALSSLARRADPRPQAAIPSLRHPDQKMPDSAFTLHAFARQWAAGAAVDLSPLTAASGHRLRLPTYPFQHERCWIEPGTRSTDTAGSRADSSTGDPVRPHRIDELDHASWSVRWQPTHAPEPAPASGSWLVIGDAGDELIDELVNELEGRGLAAAAAGEHGLPADVGDVAGVAVVAPTDDDYERSRRRWFIDAIAGVKLLGSASGPTRFVAVTRDALAAHGPGARPADAMAVGVATVAAREYSTLTARVVDLSANGAPSPIASIVDDLLGDGPQLVAHRTGRRLVPAVEPTVVGRPGTATPTFRNGGTYVVTGGLGGVGHVLATHLATTHDAALAVISSTEIPAGEARARWLANHSFDNPTSRRIRQLAALEHVGTEILVVVADVADPASVRRALDEAERRLGHIDGVIHAAGLVRDGLIELATEDDHVAVLGAKAGGALALADELERRHIELLLLVSSTSTVLAPAGQASYVGANAVLDALSGQHGSLRVATINFGVWSGVGIAADLARRARLQLGRGSPVDHPIFDECQIAPDGSMAFIGRVDAAWTWVVDEHRTIEDTAVYPGTGHVHLMQTAAELAGRENFALTDVELLTPLIVPADSPVTIRVDISSDGSIEIRSDGGAGLSWELHSHGVVSEAGDPPEAVDALDEFEALAPIPPDLLAPQRTHMHFGPRWDSIVDARRSDSVVMVRAALQSSDSDESLRWNPHPALLDMATAAGLALAEPDGGDHLYVPTGYSSVNVVRPVPSELIVRASEASDSTDDRLRVDLLGVGPNGDVVFSIERLELLRTAGNDILETAESLPSPTAGTTLIDLAADLGVRPTEGAEFVERLLASDHDRLICSTIALADLLARVGTADVDGDGHDADIGAADSLETAMAGIWSDLLGSDQIAPDENFFDLGGHSLVAIRLMARIKKELGVRLELAAIFDAPTVSMLCALLREQTPDIDAHFTDGGSGAARPTAATADRRRSTARHLVPISTTGSGRPLFVVHGAGGNVLFLGSFGRALSQRPLFGFRAHGVVDDEVPDERFEDMAVRYATELRAHAPGPYLLGGYSGGGVVALEMAKLLKEEGEQVDVVVLFDSPVGRISLGRMVHARHLLAHLIRKGPRPVWPLLASRLQATRAGRAVFFGGRTSIQDQSHETNFEDMLAHGFNDLYGHFTEASERFPVRTYEVAAILVKAQLRWPVMSDDYGWSERIEGRLEVIIAPGDHESMFHVANVGSLAAELAPLLDRFDT